MGHPARPGETRATHTLSPRVGPARVETRAYLGRVWNAPCRFHTPWLLHSWRGPPQVTRAATTRFSPKRGSWTSPRAGNSQLPPDCAGEVGLSPLWLHIHLLRWSPWLYHYLQTCVHSGCPTELRIPLPGEELPPSRLVTGGFFEKQQKSSNFPSEWGTDMKRSRWDCDTQLSKRSVAESGETAAWSFSALPSNLSCSFPEAGSKLQ